MTKILTFINFKFSYLSIIFMLNCTIVSRIVNLRLTGYKFDERTGAVIAIKKANELAKLFSSDNSEKKRQGI